MSTRAHILAEVPLVKKKILYFVVLATVLPGMYGKGCVPELLRVSSVMCDPAAACAGSHCTTREV